MPKKTPAVSASSPPSLAALKPARYNPRDITPEALKGLKASLGAFGDISGIVWNSRTGNLVAGHQRVRALQEEYGDLEIRGGAIATPQGEVRVRVVDWDEATERSANIAANNPHIAGYFTDDLQSLLSQAQADDEALFASLRLDQLAVGDTLDRDGLTDPDSAPELPPKPETKSQPGDLYLLGEHRLLCGSATVMTDVERLMAGERADLVLTDPPYNVDYESADGKQIENDDMEDADFRTFLRDAFTSMFATSRPGCPAFVFHADSEGENFRGAFRESGFALKQCCIWVKDNFVMGRQDFHWQHEPVMFGAAGKKEPLRYEDEHDPILYGWKEGAAHTWESDRKQSTVWKFPKPKSSKDHPTMKPVEMLLYAMRCSSKRGSIVADYFGGSGSTLIAAEIGRRKARVLELDPRYCDVIVRRWEEFAGKKAVLTSPENGIFSDANCKQEKQGKPCKHGKPAKPRRK